jgi:hypothetical protein
MDNTRFGGLSSVPHLEIAAPEEKAVQVTVVKSTPPVASKVETEVKDLKDIKEEAAPNEKSKSEEIS